ncbi:MAG: hypothetical protein IK093_07110, partial [Ruminiclostridium sp.]|nr:hypothetical protein [Ruminiclostridium sp.]
TRKTLTAVILCTLIAAAASCGGNTASTTTTAAQTTTTTAAETTTTAATTTAAETTTPTEETTAEEEEENPMELTGALFTSGVWEAYVDDELDSYFVFYDETSGAIIDVEAQQGTEFTCEQNGAEIVFYLGGGLIEVPAEFDLGDAEGTFHFETGDKVFQFEATDETDPEAFAAEYLSGEGEAPAALFPAGVWSATYEGELEGYYVFFDETNGTYIDAEMKAGTPFTCEQNGYEVLFDYGNGYTVQAEFAPGDAQGTFHYESIDKVVDIEYVADADPTTFEALLGTEKPTIFKKGVWTATLNGEIESYFVFYDEANGSIINPDLQTGLPFVCEQNGTEILFHIASADDNTTATFNISDNTGTFTYADGTVETYVFDSVSEDPEGFLAEIGF